MSKLSFLNHEYLGYAEITEMTHELQQSCPNWFHTMENLDARNESKEARVEPAEDLIEVRLRDEKPDKAIRIGSTLPDKVKVSLPEFLKEN